MFQRWSRICWKWSTFWKACNKQNTWDCWTCTGCNQQRLVIDSVRTRSWSGEFHKLLCLRFWHRLLAWKMSWQNSFCSFCYQSRRNIVLQLLMTWFRPLTTSQISSRKPGLWRGLRRHCPVYNFSCIFFYKCLYFSYYMAGYFLDRPVYTSGYNLI